MEVEFFVLSLQLFQFSKFYKNEAKHNKRNSKRLLSMVCEVKNT